MIGRIGGVYFAVGGVGGQVGGQVGARRIDGGFHVTRRAIDIAVQVKLQGDGGIAERTGRGHFRDPGDVAELPLQRSGNRGRHDFGTGARQSGADGNGGEVDLRQRRHRQHVEGNSPGQSDRHREQGGGHRSVNKEPGQIHDCSGCGSVPGVAGGLPDAPRTREALRQPVKENVNDRRGVKRQHLAEQQPADHADAERTAKFGADAGARGQRDAGQQRGHGRHHDGAEAQQAGFVNGLGGVLAVLALGLQGEVHHHNAVLLDDADQQDDADDGHHVQVLMEKKKCEQRAYAGGGQRGENRDRVNEALVKHAEHDIDGNQRGEDEQRLRWRANS